METAFGRGDLACETISDMTGSLQTSANYHEPQYDSDMGWLTGFDLRSSGMGAGTEDTTILRSTSTHLDSDVAGSVDDRQNHYNFGMVNKLVSCETISDEASPFQVPESSPDLDEFVSFQM